MIGKNKNLTFKLFSFLKVPVKLNLLFLILFAIMPLSYAISVFIAVMIHEMAHAFIAHKKGYNVYGIEIGLFSGAAYMDSNIHPSDSIPITAAGPISNLILFLISYPLVNIIDQPYLLHFAHVNLFLFIFNVLPIYPMDGGQIIRDFLMTKGKKLFGIDRRKGFTISAIISLVTSILLLGFSVLNGYLFMAIFAGYFGYISLKNLNYIK